MCPTYLLAQHLKLPHKVIPVFLVKNLRNIYTPTLLQMTCKESCSKMWMSSWLVCLSFNDCYYILIYIPVKISGSNWWSASWFSRSHFDCAARGLWITMFCVREKSFMVCILVLCVSLVSHASLGLLLLLLYVLSYTCVFEQINLWRVML